MRALLSIGVVCGCLVGVTGQAAAQAQPPQWSTPVRVGGNIKPPTKIRHVAPVYPDDALAARIAGLVILEANIGTDGLVRDAGVLRGVPMLNDAAVAAVTQWQYEPTLLNGVAVPVIMTVTVSFSLDGAAGGPVAPAAPYAAGGPPPGSTDPYLIQPDRVGKVWLGMPVTELTGAMPSTQIRSVPRRTPHRGLTTDIEIALEPGAPAALVMNIENARVNQIQVRNNRFRTAQGIGVGSSLQMVRQHHPALRVVMCDRGPCAVTPSGAYAFELDADAATTSDLNQLPDSARVIGVLLSKPATPAPPR